MSSYKKAKSDEFESPKKKTKLQSFSKVIYNKKKGTCFGRTPKSWILIFIFYCIFYSCLSGFFLGMISVFMYGFVPLSEPMRTGKNSILTFTPGINVYPRFSHVSALIIGSSNKTNKNFEKYKNFTNLFLKKYLASSPKIDGVLCNESAKTEPADISKFCIFDTKLLGPCENPLSELESGRMCIFLRINKIYGWLPQIAKNSTSNDLLLECDGQYPGDANNLGKPFYHPSFTENNKTYGKISNMFFPYVMQKNYTSATVGVQFPYMARNLVILVQCSLKNVENFYKPLRFEIMLIDH